MPEITATQYRARLAGAVRSEFARQDIARSELARVLGMTRQTAATRWKGVTPYNADEIDKIAALLGISAYNLNELAALGVRFDDSTPSDDEVARITPPRDVFAQPARSKTRRTA